MRKKLITKDGWQVIVEYEFFKIFFGKVLPKEAEPPMMLHS
jgi:hypothetical protein